MAGGILTGNTPLGIAPGSALRSLTGSARDQSDATTTVNAGKVLEDGGIGGVTSFINGSITSCLAKRALALTVDDGIATGLHYTTRKGLEGIMRDGVIRAGRGGNVFGWAKPVPKPIRLIIGGRGDYIAPFQVPADEVFQNGWGAIIHPGDIFVR